jgi:hypothetical protein
MNKRLLDALENCLQRLEQGEALDSVLVAHPEQAAQLRPLLETAVRARSASPKDLSQAALARQRARGLALAADLRQAKNRPFFMQRRFWRPAVTILAVIALLVMSSNGLLIASAHSIPGDTLYPLKRSVESTRLQLASDPAKKQALEHTFNERRVDETKSLIGDERVESVEFSGVVMSQSEGEWLVSGISVIVTPLTEIDKGIRVGDEIEVRGSTNAAGGVDATRLSLESGSDTELDNPEESPMQTPSLGESGESELTEAPTESSIAPTDSGGEGSPENDGEDQPAKSSEEEHSSEDTPQTPQPDSESGGD